MGRANRQKYTHEGLQRVILESTIQAMRDVEGGPYDLAQLSAHWLLTTGWRLLVAFEVTTSEAAITRWTIERLNVREIYTDLTGGRRDP